MTIQWNAKEKCEWNQGVVFYVANVTGKRLKNVRAVLILIILSGELVRSSVNRSMGIYSH